MPNSFEQQWLARLDERAQQSLLRIKPTCSSAVGVELTLDGDKYLSFASNDYLGLANHSLLVERAKDAANRFGVGGGASHMVCGHHSEHQKLEEELAEFTGRDRALVFSSGYMANLALVSTLVGKQDIVLQDKLNHASLLDGGLLSGARFQRYLHNDADSLDRYIKKFQSKSDIEAQKTLVVTDGVFSMDGDISPLPDLVSVCDQNSALLMVDDAHGFGVLGESGAGSIEHYKLSQDQVPVLIGTFGKAFGTAGAFVAGSTQLIDYIEQFARPYIYTTSIPPMVAAATRASLSLIKNDSELRERLLKNINYFRKLSREANLNLMPSDTAIQPVLVGSNESTMALAESLKQKGIWVGAIRPPTVPNNQARIRVTLSALHDFTMIERLVETMHSSMGVA